MGIFSGQRPEKMLSRAKARDKEEEIPRKQIPHFLATARKWDSCNESWDVFSGIQRELACRRGRRKPLCRAFARARFLLFGWFLLAFRRLSNALSKLVLGKGKVKTSLDPGEHWRE